MHWQNILGQTLLSKIADDLDISDMWAAVRQVTGKSQSDRVTVDGISASSLNFHYADVSTDMDYQAPSPKQTSNIHPHVDYLSEWEVFRLLDTLHSTATDSDELPS